MNATPAQIHELIELAARARLNAYAPYSRFKVGAALLARSGRIYTGCNVENASYSLTICAERAALFRAVSEGEREFTAIVIVTDRGVSPCGACRQVLREFGRDLRVIVADTQEHQREYTLGELLPDDFKPEDLT
jgi:cytidine deaminase